MNKFDFYLLNCMFKKKNIKYKMLIFIEKMISRIINERWLKIKF